MHIECPHCNFEFNSEDIAYTLWNYRQLARESNHAWVAAKLSPTEKIAIETTAGTVIKPGMANSSAYFKGIEFETPGGTNHGVNRKNLQPDVYRDIITSRRSIRQFKNAPVPRDVIEQVLDLARYAPTASNDQNVGYIVVTDKHLIEETANTIFGFTHRKKPGSRPTTATLPQQPSSIMLMLLVWELV
jgi:hypothetical protein